MSSNPDKNEFRKYAVKHHRIGGHHVDKFIGNVNHTPSGITTVPMVTGMTPYILEERQLNVQAMDVFSRLMMDRIIFLGDAIYDQNANIIQAQLLFLQSADAKRDIQIYINSPGGSVYAGLGIYDTMQLISNDVATICTGMAASMGAVLLCAGTDGKRAALPHSRVMIHQPSGGAQGQQSDIEISYHEITKLKKELYQIIADHSGASYEKVHDASDRDYWMTSEEAKEFGMIDEILKGAKTKSK
jgi:ATP-dependent Clp protease protease subunit